MHRILLIVLFTISSIAGYAQKTSSRLDSNNSLPLKDSLLIRSFSITKFQDTKQKQIINTDLLFRDTSENTQNYVAPKLDGNIVMDNLKTTKFKKTLMTTIQKRDLLLRDTDQKTQLIYPSYNESNRGN
ncbi:hypothetical protein ACFOWA_10415 [Pedobacter lithocola]|uniref:GLPGLI family protein n=1 Tax=Pedobacter lithocola TaxID=1908239 RepID=A0ABV8P8R8_9SPHI